MVLGFNRRAALLAAGGLLAAPRLGHAQAARVRMTLDWAFQSPNAFALVAREKGYFRAAGVDVTVDRGQGSGGVPVALAGGSYDMGYADLKANPHLATNNDRVRARPTLMPDLRQRLANHSAAELAAIFEKHGLPFAPISRPEQLLDDPHLNATGGLADITLPDGERAGQTARTTLLPLAMNGQRLGVRLQPPVLGQHTADLMQELGYTPEQVQALQQAGAVA